MRYVPQSTTITLPVGPFIDETSGVAVLLGQTLGAMDAAELWKNGSATPTDISGANYTFASAEIGMYQMTYDGAAFDTLGHARAAFKDDSAHLYVWEDYEVIATNVYNALIGGGDNLQVDTVQIGGETASATSVIATISGAEASNAIVGYRLDHLLIASAANGDFATSSAFARVMTIGEDIAGFDNTNDTLEAIGGIVQLNNDGIGSISDTDLATLTVNLGWIEGVAATTQIGSIVDARIVNYRLDNILLASATDADIATSSAFARLMTISEESVDFASTTDSLEAIAANAAGDWTSDEKATLRYALGVTGTQTPPTAASQNLTVDVTTIEGSIATTVIGSVADARIVAYRLDNILLASATDADIATSSAFARLMTISEEPVDFASATDSLEAIAANAAGDWTSDEKENIRWALAVTGTGNPAAAGSMGVITQYHLDQFMATAVIATDVSTDSALAQLANSDANATWTGFDNTTDSLQAIADGAATGDWTSDEKDTLRYRLGVTGTQTPPTAASVNLSVDVAFIEGVTATAALATISGAEASNAIVGYHLNVLVEASAADADIATSSAFARLMAKSEEAADFASDTHSLEGIVDGMATLGDINATMDQALADIHLTALFTASATDSLIATSSAFARLMTISEESADFASTTDSLEAIAANAAGDWTSDEKENIRWALAVTGTGNPAAAGSMGVITQYHLDQFMATGVIATDVSTDSALAQLANSDANATWTGFDNTTDSLQAIADGAATGDWTSDEKENIRYTLGVTGTQTPPSNSSQNMTVNVTTVGATLQQTIFATVMQASFGLDHLVVASATDGDIATSSIFARLMAISEEAADFASSTDSLEAIAANAAGDWTSDEKDTLRYRLGVTGTQTPPTAASVNLSVDVAFIEGVAATSAIATISSEEATNALVGFSLDHVLFSSASDAVIANSSAFARLMTADETAASFASTTDSLEGLANGQASISGAQLATTDLSSFTIDVAFIDGVTATAALGTITKAEADQALTDYDPPTDAEMDTKLATLTVNVGWIEGATATAVISTLNVAAAGSLTYTAVIEGSVGTLASINAWPEPVSFASVSAGTFDRLWGLWGRFFHQNVQTSNTQATYESGATAVIAERAVTESSDTQTLGGAS